MKILAIDPGYDRCGVAILKRGKSQKHELVFSACVTTDKTSSFERRLNQVYVSCNALIEQYKPESIALERLYFTNNQKTAMRVAEVRGMLLQLANTHELVVSEYTPSQIKVAVAGSGSAPKGDIQRMIPLLVHIESRKRLDDEYDAIAIGLTHLACTRPISA